MSAAELAALPAQTFAFVKAQLRAPVLDAEGLALAQWIAEQSLSSLGGTLAALLPPIVLEREASLKRGWPDREGRGSAPVANRFGAVVR